MHHLLGAVKVFPPHFSRPLHPNPDTRCSAQVVQRYGQTSEVDFELAGPGVPQRETHVPITVITDRWSAPLSVCRLWVCADCSPSRTSLQLSRFPKSSSPQAWPEVLSGTHVCIHGCFPTGSPMYLSIHSSGIRAAPLRRGPSKVCCSSAGSGDQKVSHGMAGPSRCSSACRRGWTLTARGGHGHQPCPSPAHPGQRASETEPALCRNPNLKSPG